jgi:hypothetical protein
VNGAGRLAIAGGQGAPINFRRHCQKSPRGLFFQDASDAELHLDVGYGGYGRISLEDVSDDKDSEHKRRHHTSGRRKQGVRLFPRMAAVLGWGPPMSIAATPIGRLPGFHQLRIVAAQRRQTGHLAREHRDDRGGNWRAAHVVSQGPNVPGRVPAWELASSHQYYSRSPGDQTDIATVMGGGGIEWLILFYRASERVFTARVRA